jgi:SHS2 domain-containing protein
MTRDTNILCWLKTYFPGQDQENETQDETETETETVLAVPSPILSELSRLDSIDELYKESLRIESRAGTAKAERKLRQIERDRESVRQAVVKAATTIKHRKKQDEKWILTIIDELI